MSILLCSNAYSQGEFLKDGTILEENKVAENNIIVIMLSKTKSSSSQGSTTTIAPSAKGTSRPTHYHVLLDQVGFSPDQLQKLVHSISYVYQRSTTAISVVASICYAHLAATQLGQFMKFEDKSKTSSSHGGLSGADAGAGAVPVPQLPSLQEKVRNTMFFC